MPDAAGFEGAGGLEVVEFEEDAAGGLLVGGVEEEGVVWGRRKGRGRVVGETMEGRGRAYHPATWERARDSMQGVSLQSFW